MNLLGIFVSYLFVGGVIAVAKFFERFGKEASRKFIHIVLSFWWILAMYFFDNVWYAVFVPATFVIINYLSARYNMIPTMERDDEEGYGTVYYAVSLLILVATTWTSFPWIGAIGFFIMAYGDGFAAVVGKKYPYIPYQVFGNKKTVSGTITMWVFSFLVTFLFFSIYDTNFGWLEAILIATIATILEAVSPRDLDNIFVPCGSSAAVYLLFIL